MLIFILFRFRPYGIFTTYNINRQCAHQGKPNQNKIERKIVFLFSIHVDLYKYIKTNKKKRKSTSKQTNKQVSALHIIPIVISTILYNFHFNLVHNYECLSLLRTQQKSNKTKKRRKTTTEKTATTRQSLTHSTTNNNNINAILNNNRRNSKDTS